jgi:hypothetical protein
VGTLLLEPLLYPLKYFKEKESTSGYEVKRAVYELEHLLSFDFAQEGSNFKRSQSLHICFL